MKKNSKTLWKKIAHILSLFLIIASLVLGITFSSIKVSDSLGYGPAFNGSFEASVQVINQNKNNQISKETIAQGLQDKLSPFSDVPVTVSIAGQNHLLVNVSKTSFNNNPRNLRAAIQTTGGMFVLNRGGDSAEFEDLYTKTSALSAVGAETRINASDLFTNQLDVSSLINNNGRSPYLHLGLKGDNNDFTWAKVIDAVDKEGQGNGGQPAPSQYYFITDFESLIDEIKNLYVDHENDRDFIDLYYEQVIKPAQKVVNEQGTSPEQRETLRDVFAGEIQWTVGGTGNGITRRLDVSLLDNNFTETAIINGKPVQGINNADDLYTVLNEGKFSNLDPRFHELDYFLYSSDATKEDFDTRYKDNRVSVLNGKPNLGSIQNTFKYVTNFFLSKVILNDEETLKNTQGKVVLNENLSQLDSTIKDHFIFNGGIFNNTTGSITVPELTGAPGLGFITIPIDNGNVNQLDAGLYIPSQSLTVGRKAVASIRQNALGITYRVEEIHEIEAPILTVMKIISIVFLLIIVLALIIYLLFVYRLLGLFTIIIAVTTAALTLVFATIFGITVGPQLIMALFLIIGLTVDLAMILFDSFSEKIYQGKQAVKTAFKIANKETIALSIDAIIVALIPNIIMFWVGDGDLKNFATIATIGIFLALIFGIVVLRFTSWLILKVKTVQNNGEILPINTGYALNLSLKKQYLVSKYESYLEHHEGQEQYSSKELLKMKRANEKLAKLNQELDIKRQENLAKLKVSDEKEVAKLQKQIKKLQIRKEAWIVRHLRFLGIAEKIKTHYDYKIEELQSIIATETLTNVSEKTSQSVSKRAQVLKTERRFNRGGIIVLLVILLMSIFATVIGFTVGPNWGSGFGRGQQFVVYGDRIERTYNYTIGAQRPANWEETLVGIKAQQIGDDPTNKAAIDAAQKAVDESSGRTPIEIANLQKALLVVKADQVAQLYTYIINEGLYTSVPGGSPAKGVDLHNWTLLVNDNYAYIDPETGIAADNTENQVAIIINSNATDKLSRTNFRRFLRLLSDPSSFPWVDIDSDHRDQVGGIVAYDLTPFSSIELVKQILIVFGIMLAALIIYIVIRFKWTYYVALALGLVLTFAGVIAAVILFQIPITIELLSGFALLISFALITMILILGKGKSILSVDDRKTMNDKFSDELEQTVLIRQKKNALNEKINEFNIKIKKLNKKIKQMKKADEVDHEAINALKVEIKKLKIDKKAQRKTNNAEFKLYKKDAKGKIHVLSRKNFYFKEVYLDLIKFSLKRLLTIGMFYIVTAIILLTTLAPMFGMGLIVLIGIVVAFVVTLFVVIPLWILLERYRLRNASGFRVYMNNIKVSHEEQIVADVND